MAPTSTRCSPPHSRRHAWAGVGADRREGPRSDVVTGRYPDRVRAGGDRDGERDLENEGRRERRASCLSPLFARRSESPPPPGHRTAVQIAYVEDYVCCEQHIGSDEGRWLRRAAHSSAPSTSPTSPRRSTSSPPGHPTARESRSTAQPNVNGTVGARGVWVANADGTNLVLLVPGGLALVVVAPREPNRVRRRRRALEHEA